MNCFVIMPFSNTEHTVNKDKKIITSEEWNHIYNEWIKKAVESYGFKTLKCKRSETIQGNFVKGIIKDIYNSELAIADLTGQKPNVYYELGIRHSLKLGTIIITQDFNALPSDLRSYYCVTYKYSEKSHHYKEYYKKFEEDLHSQITSVLENINQPDNPVSDFLDLKHYYQIKEEEKNVMILLRIIGEFQTHLTEIIYRFKTILSNKEVYLKENRIFFTFIDFGHMDATFTMLQNFEFQEFDLKNINKLKVFYLVFRKELFEIHQYWEGTRSNINKNNIKTLLDSIQNFYDNAENTVLSLEKIFKEIKSEYKISQRK